MYQGLGGNQNQRNRADGKLVPSSVSCAQLPPRVIHDNRQYLQSDTTLHNTASLLSQVAQQFPVQNSVNGIQFPVPRAPPSNGQSFALNQTTVINHSIPQEIKNQRSKDLNNLTQGTHDRPTFQQAMDPITFPFIETARQCGPADHGVVHLKNVSVVLS